MKRQRSYIVQKQRSQTATVDGKVRKKQNVSIDRLKTMASTVYGTSKLSILQSVKLFQKETLSAHAFVVLMSVVCRRDE